MKFGARKSLGISFGSRSLLVAEVHANGAPRVVRAAEFQFDEADSLQDPASLGKKLAQFLKQNGFSANQVVFGLPAQWLMMKDKSLPPAAPELIPGMLRIQAERDFSLEPSSLSIDYITGRSSSDGQAVALVAALRERIDQIRSLATAAGLKSRIITGTSLALLAATQASTLLYVGPNGAELILRGKDGLPRVRHISTASVKKDTPGSPFVPELRRAIAMAQPAIEEGELHVWDDGANGSALLRELGTEIDIPVKKGERFSGAPLEGAIPAHAAGSAALALCLVQPLAPVDFLNSRLDVKPPSKLSSLVVWGSVAAFVVLAGLSYLVIDWRQSAQEVAELRQKQLDMKDNLDAAKGFINRVNATRTWYERRPNYLECLRAVTLTFPEEGRVWTSSLTLREDMRGILNGRASDEKSVLDVLDKLKSGQNFADVKMLHMRGSGTKGSEISFAISFGFLGTE